MSAGVRILLLADSHLGFDLPVRPRAVRRRRGHDFLANYARALEPALRGEVDIVVHAGDVFDRSHVVSTLAYQAFEPLRRIADLGVPVFVVPGNHERSKLPHLRFARHENVYIFDTPRTFVVNVRGTRLALSGFPYERHDVRAGFARQLDSTAWSSVTADVHMLCIHHCVEGATVGPSDYVFTTASDVVRLRDVPRAFSAVLTGHVHRHQVLTTDLAGIPLAAPVIYPGSIERTAFAEMGEPKGFMVVDVQGSTSPAISWEFRELPARPMIRRELSASGLTAAGFGAAVETIIAEAPADAVLSIRMLDALTSEQWGMVSARRLRALAPHTMNVEISPSTRFELSTRSAYRTVAGDTPQMSLHLV